MLSTSFKVYPPFNQSPGLSAYLPTARSLSLDIVNKSEIASEGTAAEQVPAKENSPDTFPRST